MSQEIEFSSELRADWYTNGCPENHDYHRWLYAKRPAEKIEGLVTFADGSRYGGSGS